jgi:hypothetical protein
MLKLMLKMKKTVLWLRVQAGKTRGIIMRSSAVLIEELVTGTPETVSLLKSLRIQLAKTHQT